MRPGTQVKASTSHFAISREEKCLNEKEEEENENLAVSLHHYSPILIDIIYKYSSCKWGDWVAQLVERRTRIQWSRVRIPPVRSTRTFL